MTEPVDAILAIHNAVRNDIGRIDAAALDAAKGKEGLAATIERFRFFNEVLVWHATGEELAIFPALEKVALWLLKRISKITVVWTRLLTN